MSDQSRIGGVSAAVQSVVCVLIVVPLAQAAVWGALSAFGGESGATVLLGVGCSAFCGVYAFGPSRWLADPAIAGRFGRDYPTGARVICGFGVALGLVVAAVGLV